MQRWTDDDGVTYVIGPGDDGVAFLNDVAAAINGASDDGASNDGGVDHDKHVDHYVDHPFTDDYLYDPVHHFIVRRDDINVD